MHRNCFFFFFFFFVFILTEHGKACASYLANILVAFVLYCTFETYIYIYISLLYLLLLAVVHIAVYI